ncbi:hypothetical protein H2200_004927 [Cladophialophora chaetospira]|uniref:Uncharacterized protein n=1 Tax=Cladophialophora chaetospira TaxID=386627 RepID=A0AA38XE03_9EURO|nr:hypothetical protein H2200_004927 [Cladophialophora chaetospira]
MQVSWRFSGSVVLRIGKPGNALAPIHTDESVTDELNIDNPDLKELSGVGIGSMTNKVKGGVTRTDCHRTVSNLHSIVEQMISRAATITCLGLMVAIQLRTVIPVRLYQTCTVVIAAS